MFMAERTPLPLRRNAERIQANAKLRSLQEEWEAIDAALDGDAAGRYLNCAGRLRDNEAAYFGRFAVRGPYV